MIRKVRFPLRYKFIAAISTLLLLTMTFYLSYALNIFKEDKAADVYSITLTNSVSLAERLKLIIEMDLAELQNLSTEESTWSAWLQNVPYAMALECLKADSTSATQFNSKLVSGELNLNARNILSRLISGASAVERGELAGMDAHYLVASALPNGMKCAVYLSIDKLMPLMNETLKYGSYIISDSGRIFLQLNDKAISPATIRNIVSDKTIAEIQQGVKKFNENNQPVIRAFAKVQPYGLLAFTEIEEEKAFLASAQLINKSLFFGILILSVAVITGILFTRRMTTNVQTLFAATTQMAEGNFDVQPVAGGHDEIGALTDSFVDMKNKIVAFMEEMKEKARIENEIKVAQLVQNQFFPRHGLIKRSFSIEGMYTPASECSGDWWGFFEQQGKVTLIACDATGHGVPAALITAAAHSCISSLKIDSEQKHISPKNVLEKLNKVICSLNSDILMTAFVLEIDEESKKVVYANASHMAPYHLQKTQGTYSKEGLNALIENNGPRMGETWNSTYQESSFFFKSGDRIVLFSDGLTEMEVDGKPWGQRNFLKSLYKQAAQPAKAMIESIWTDFEDFIRGNVVQDDVTLIAVNFAEEIPHFTDMENAKTAMENKPDYAISSMENDQNIKLLAETKLNHLIGHNTINLEAELKLVQILESRETFNLDETIGDEYKKKKWSLLSVGQFRQAIDEMTALFRNDYTPAITDEILQLVSEELLSNAFYHSNGNNRGVNQENVLLTPDKAIEYMVATNNDYVVISVYGHSAFSSREKIVESIHRGHESKAPLEHTPGAGLGLYLIYQNCQQFWVINSPKNQGQIICVFEKFNRYKKAKERITSFHYIQKEIVKNGY